MIHILKNTSLLRLAWATTDDPSKALRTILARITAQFVFWVFGSHSFGNFWKITFAVYKLLDKTCASTSNCLYNLQILQHLLQANTGSTAV